MLYKCPGCLKMYSEPGLCKRCKIRSGNNSCLKCGKRIKKGRHYCDHCIQEVPYDLIINRGTFHAELHSEMISSTKLKKLLNLVDKIKE